MPARAFITGLAGLEVSANERAFLREAEPWGLIVFKRNIKSREQVYQLTSSFREIVGWMAPVLVDQEGGRVQQLGPPQWPAYPPAAQYGELYDREPELGIAAARLAGRLIAADLAPIGIDVDCSPVADIPVAGADRIIGDRAYGEKPGKVAALAAAMATGLMSGGVLPIVKHLPGHGRATLDGHFALPVVTADRTTLEATDFAAFRPLNGLPFGMTAHVVFSAIDPVAPATTSVKIVREVIRGFIGFRGLLMSDDVSMEPLAESAAARGRLARVRNAIRRLIGRDEPPPPAEVLFGTLSGTITERSRAALAAGCDVVLHCNGNMAEMSEVAAVAPMLTGMAATRADAALAARKSPEEFDIGAARSTFAEMVTAEQPATQRMTGL